ncbi:sulfurtransferase TusA family protein [Deferrisoma camini]|uniref:sulfurtransferase TusA family protein n=1 Tax=Deferrisoma camini TaxID=1035120 RepID=UPI00046D135A|nr:sulfurtransferase TusA family protein [Deferrisoma camini]
MQTLDITGDVCPMTMVRVRMGLEQVEPGGELEILMAAGEPVTSIPRMLRDEGHEILAVERDGEAFRLRVRKKT